MSVLTVTIAGVDRTAWVKPESIGISGGLSDTWKARFTLCSKRDGYRPVMGSQVAITQTDPSPAAAVTVFAGRILSTREHAGKGTLIGDEALIFIEVECVDNTQVLCDRLITSAYQDATVYDIITHLNNIGLSGEGISIAEVEDPGPTITDRLVFDHATVKEVLDRLSQITGHSWYLDFDKVLHFGEFTSNHAPFDISETEGEWFDIEVLRDDSGYLNKITERGAQAWAPKMTETFTATEDQMQFPTSMPIATILSISLTRSGTTTAQTFIGVDYPNSTWPAPGSAGYDFSFFSNMACEEFDAVDWASIAAGDVIVIEYLPSLPAGLDGAPAGPTSKTASDAAAIAARAAITGGSGIVERFESQANISDPAMLETIAESRLRQKSGAGSVTLSAGTWAQGAYPGQYTTATLPWHGISGVDFLIQSISLEWVVRAAGDRFKARITGTNTEPSSVPIDILAGLLRGGGGGASPSVAGSIAFAQPGEVVAPIGTDFSWVNQGSAIEDTSRGGIYIEHPASATHAWHLKVTSAPTAPYTLTIKFLTSRVPPNGAPAVLFRDSVSGKMHALCLSSSAFGMKLFRYSGTGDGDYQTTLWSDAGQLDVGFSRFMTLQIEDDGANRNYYVTPDGEHRIKIFTEGRTSYFTADQLGFGLFNATAYPCGMWVVSWEEK